MSRPAYLIGHLTAEFAATVLAITIMVDQRPDRRLGDHLLGRSKRSAGFGLLFLLAITMIWLGTLVGVLVRSPDAVQGIAFVAVFPLTFVANTFVPVGGLPDGLRQVAEYNPISAWAAAIRTLFGNPTAIPDGRRLAARAPGDRRDRPGASRSSRSSSRSPCAPTAGAPPADDVDGPKSALSQRFSARQRPSAPPGQRRRARQRC